MSIRLFDVQGRLRRVITSHQWLGPGAHDLAIDGMDDAGAPLGSGVYFYRVDTAEGAANGRAVILK